MRPTGQPPPPRLFLALYRAVFLFSPRAFREEWGVEVMETLRSRATDAEAILSAPRLTWFWVRELAVALRMGIRLRREEGIRRRRSTGQYSSETIGPKGGGMLEGVWMDVRLALRSVKKAPGFALG